MLSISLLLPHTQNWFSSLSKWENNLFTPPGKGKRIIIQNDSGTACENKVINIQIKCHWPKSQWKYLSILCKYKIFPGNVKKGVHNVTINATIYLRTEQKSIKYTAYLYFMQLSPIKWFEKLLMTRNYDLLMHHLLHCVVYFVSLILTL